jgi:MFS family permease
MEKNSKGFHYGFLVLIACCSMGLTTAINLNCIGIFMVPVTEDLGISRGAFSLYFTIQSFSAVPSLPIAGKIMAKANARILLSVMVLIQAIMIGSMSTFTSVFQFYVAAVFIGISYGFVAIVAPPTLIYRWFSAKTGLFIGLSSAFTGIGAVVLNPVGGYIITYYGWRTAYLVFGVVIAVVFVLVASFIRSYPCEMGLEPYGYKEETTTDTNTDSEIDTGVSVSAAIKSTPFFILIIYVIALALHNAFNVFLPSYVNSIGKGISIGAAIASTSMAGLLLGKMSLGYLNDKTVIGTMTVCGVCGFTGLGLITFFGPINSGYLLLGAFLYGICLSSAGVQTPLLVKKIFGLRQFSQIYSIVFMIFNFAFGIGQALWGFIADAMSGSYFVPLSIIMGLSAVVPVASSLAYKFRIKLSLK